MQHNEKVNVRLMLMMLLCLRFAVAAQDDPRVEKLYGEAKAAQAENDISDAIGKYQEILRLAPKLGPAYNNLGALYFRQRDYLKAAETLEKGLKVDPGMTSALALLGISLYEANEYKQARPRLEAAVQANPNDNNARLFLVRDLAQLGDADAGAAELQQLAKRQPENQEVWYMLAKVYMKLSENAMAKINQIDPNSVLALQLSGEMMEAMNNYEGAVVQLKKAVDLAPQKPGSHYKLGEAYWGLSQWDSAAAEYQAELAVDPGNCRAHWRLGSVLNQKGRDSEQALKQLDEAEAQCPSLTEVHADRARALVTLGRNADAVPELEAAVKADPAEPRNHFLLAKAYRALGRGQEAQAEMQAFSKLDEAARAATAERAQEVIKNKETAH
jgi:tetratricopeptide (TPR) repeat protein